MSTPLRVLIVDPSEDDAWLLVATLTDGGYAVAFERVDTLAALEAALQAQPWDAVIADFAIPELGGAAVPALLQRHDLDIPVLAVSRALGEEAAVAAMKAGAHDYLRKDNLARLAPAIERELREAASRQQHRQAEQARLQTEARFQRIVELSPDGVLIVDAAGTIRLANPASARMLGMSEPDLVVGQSIATFVAPEEADGDTLRLGPLSLTRLLTPGAAPERGETWFIRVDGEGFAVEVDAAACEWDGQPAVQLIVRDISERKWAEERIRREASRAEALVRVAARLNAQLDLQAVLGAICEETAQALGVPMVVVGLNDRHSQQLHLVEAFGLPAAARPKASWIARLPFGPVGSAHGRRQGSLILLKDLRKICDAAAIDPQALCGLHTLIGITLRRDGQVIGVLCIGTLETIRHFTDDELTLLAGLADQGAQAIANARLFNDAKRRFAYLQALHAIDLATTASLDLRVVFNVVLEQVVTNLHVHAADILVLNPYGQVLDYAAGRGFQATGFQRVRLRVGEGLAGRAALERRVIGVPQLTPDAVDGKRVSLVIAERFVSAFAVPLIVKGQVKGVLELFHREPLTPDQEWLQFLEALSTQAAIAIDNAALFADLQRSNAELILAYDATIEGWSRALELRDKETEGHTLRVTEMTIRLAQALDVPDAELIHIRRGALLHDIGKMGIPDRILLKPGPLNEHEWEIMQRHPIYAFEMLSPIAFLRPALDIPYCHHEKWDGTGYPRGLKGEHIPLAARIFAIADVWDALRSDRPYRQSWSEERVLQHVISLAGSHFDPRVVDIFHRLYTELPELVAVT